MKTLENLVEIGFNHVGEWYLNIDNLLDYNLIDDGSKELLYSFVQIDGNEKKIIYIGKTIKSLTNRMKGYKKPGNSQNTNIRLNKVINEFLLSNHKILIYVFKNDKNIMYKDVKINLAAGLEDVLINMFKPKFNLHGNSRIVEETETNEDNILIELINPIVDNNCFTSKKKASNSNLEGKINLSFIPNEYLPDFGENVTIHLDNLIFDLYFRNGNNIDNYDPRINSKLIGIWLTERINVGDIFYVKVCNKNTFYFYTNAQ